MCEVGDGVFEGYGFKATHSNTAPWTYEDLTAAVGDPNWFIDFPTGIGEYGHIIAWATYLPTGLRHGVLLTPVVNTAAQ